MRIDIDSETGQVKVFSQKTVAEKVEDPDIEYPFDEAQENNPEIEPGDEIEVEVTPQDFGRIAAQTAKQVIMQRIREAERGVIYEKFRNREGDIVTGTVQRLINNNVMIDLGSTEALLMPSEQMPNDNYTRNQRLKVYIVEVEKTTKGPRILVSRTHPNLLKRLFELEVPEIHDGIVEIKSLSREAGSRSKVAVSSRIGDVDAVGACVGPKGMRVQAIVEELNGEKIDIVAWDENEKKFIANALSPANVEKVIPHESDQSTQVIVPDYQLSLAIGKEGQNARLAAKLTGWKIDIKSETQAQQMGLLDSDGKPEEDEVEIQLQDSGEEVEEGSEI